MWLRRLRPSRAARVVQPSLRACDSQDRWRRCPSSRRGPAPLLPFCPLEALSGWDGARPPQGGPSAPSRLVQGFLSSRNTPTDVPGEHVSPALGHHLGVPRPRQWTHLYHTVVYSRWLCWKKDRAGDGCSRPEITHCSFANVQ